MAKENTKAMAPPLSAREDTQLSDGDIEEACNDVDKLIADSPSFTFQHSPHNPARQSSPHRHHNCHSYTATENGNHHNGQNKRHRHGRRARGNKKETSNGKSTERRICTIWIWTLALLVPFTLIISSGEREYIAMSPGETRALYFPAIMTESLHIRRTSLSTPTASNFTIHQFDGECPPLTGPVDVKTTSENMTLLPSNYVYRSMYLNAGSKVNVNLTAWNGVVEMYLFRGDLAFGEWRDHPEYGYISTTTTSTGGSYASRSEKKRKDDNGAMKPLHIEHDVVSSDTFYLIYYNPKRRKDASLTADVRVQMTTHDLDGNSGVSVERTTCHDSLECSVKTGMWKTQCTIIRADDGWSDLENDLDRYPILSLQIARYRRWSIIYAITLIPVFLAILYADGTRTCGGVGEDEDKDVRRIKRMYESSSPSLTHDIQVVIHPTEATPLTRSSSASPRLSPPNDTHRVRWASPIDRDTPAQKTRASPPIEKPQKRVSWARDDVRVVIHPSEATPLTQSSSVSPRLSPSKDTHRVRWASPIDRDTPARNTRASPPIEEPRKRVSWARDVVICDHPPSFQKRQMSTPSA